MWLVFTNRFIGFRLLELLHWRHLFFCDKGVAGSSSLEILATFSNNIMKKHGSEKLTDEAIEETLEKVVKLLACISDKDLFAEFYGCIEVSRDFYQTKTMHRKLTWIYSFGTCNINGKFEPKTMELIVTTYQVPLLLADEKEVIEDVDKDGGMLSMCIVKSQKVLNHQGYGECVEQLSHMFKLLEHGMKISGSVVNISGGGY